MIAAMITSRVFAQRRPACRSHTVSLFLLACRRPAAVTLAILLLALAGTPAAHAGPPPPNGFADLAEKLLPSVVNISTTQTLKPENHGEQSANPQDRPHFPPGSPFEEFFKDFFDHNSDQGDNP